jgi:hypothetical protein
MERGYLRGFSLPLSSLPIKELGDMNKQNSSQTTPSGQVLPYAVLRVAKKISKINKNK